MNKINRWRCYRIKELVPKWICIILIINDDTSPQNIWRRHWFQIPNFHIIKSIRMETCIFDTLQHWLHEITLVFKLGLWIKTFDYREVTKKWGYVSLQMSTWILLCKVCRYHCLYICMFVSRPFKIFAEGYNFFGLRWWIKIHLTTEKQPTTKKGCGYINLNSCKCLPKHRQSCGSDFIKLLEKSMQGIFFQHIQCFFHQTDINISINISNYRPERRDYRRVKLTSIIRKSASTGSQVHRGIKKTFGHN